MLNEWREAPLDATCWYSGDLRGAPTPAQPETDVRAWPLVDLAKPRYAPAPVPVSDWRRARWYRARVAVPAGMRSKPLFLECPRVDELYAYVDGQFVGYSDPHMSSVFDLSAFSERKSFEVTLASRHAWTSAWNLMEAPKLVAMDSALRGTWHRCDGRQGEREQWPTQPTGWQPLAGLPPARVAWYRRTVCVQRPAGLAAPVYVELDANWRRHAVIYWNGVARGQFADVGPDRRFYLPDSEIKTENHLVIAVDGYDGQAACGELRLGVYHQMREITMHVGQG